ncbi:MAG: DUF6512 family protein [Candidatus Paceibacterota bacterium]|jgi:hypothetical protein|nr:DUF6512 family protein [Candidatus Paceibacterota bacterium]MDD5621046.1 DUF6512 family protein [Candidatus Paceibacterota bacterium]
MNKKLLKIYIAGTIFSILLGSFLHFTYAMSGNRFIIGLFSAVNESVWEHLKLAVFPFVFFGILEIFLFKKEIKKFLFAKLTECLIAPIFIIVFFYTYTGIIGKSVLVVDILSFVVAVILGRILSYRIMKRKEVEFSAILSGVCLILIILSFVLFSINPPRILLFRDSVTGGYGMKK